MDSIIPAVGGLLSLSLGLIFHYSHKKFVKSSIEIDGKILDVVTKNQGSRSSGGRRVRNLPIVGYEFGKNYKFRGEVDVRDHKLEIGDNVKVLVHRDNEKIAKLNIGNKERRYLNGIFIFLGIVGVILSIITFDPQDYDIPTKISPLTMAMVVGGMSFIFLKARPLLSIFNLKSTFFENATEINE